MAEEMKPHVAFLPSPGMGHITPLFQLAKRLVLRHGIRVSFLVITTAAVQNFLHSAASTLSPGLSIIKVPPADVITADMPVLTQTCLSLRESLKPLKSILIQLNPNALIIDMFTTDAIDVCTDLSVPVYSFFPASTILLAFSLHLPTLDHEIEGEYVDVPGPIQVPGCKPIRTADLLDQVKNRKIDEYKWYLFHVNRLRFVAGILINTWENLDRSTLKALRENSFFQNLPTPRIYPVGPLIKDEEHLTDHKDEEIIAWLDTQPRESVLLVSFGSGGILSGEQIIELALGLEMSQQRFILVVRRPAHAKAAVVSFGNHDEDNNPSEYLPDGFVERTRGVGLVVPAWAPQVAVLRHPSTGAFLSHCGWNSTVESLAHGVPMIAWPLYAEQRMNAALLVEEVGVAVRVRIAGEEVVGREEVERVVRMVIEGEEGKGMRSRARELKETARQAFDSGGSSFDSLCSVVESWKTHGA
ncbi:hypothetical protein BUALT_Bualt08G0064400 [Buddleja alternifolia]|uniref:Glycosyltransferase n=1 Tax=Buddleja alternifolia TaxID=168488 RepID=A0AAV6XF27_9LAMI|nr:hypothetical protein BUALT_Bualt08G0064400 [Buddleja alternifolia]